VGVASSGGGSGAGHGMKCSVHFNCTQLKWSLGRSINTKADA
jgi:hypothetical protein